MRVTSAGDAGECALIATAGSEGPVLRFRQVRTSENDSDHDACPNCGARVESAISAPGEPLREATERRCPSCGKVLRREIGGNWTVDETAS